MIYIGCDAGALNLKNLIVEHLKQSGKEYKDLGTFDTKSVDYPDYAVAVAKSVAQGGEDCRGILLCRTGIGMSIAANKVKGIRCALCSNKEVAKLTREHNNSNILALGADFCDIKTATEIVEIFLNTPFSTEERHHKRVDKINNIC